MLPIPRKFLLALCVGLLLAGLLAGPLAGPARAQDGKTPYWASIRVDEVNMRVGPGEDYRIRWVFHREQLPVKVLRLKDGWRLIEDPDGARGWMLSQFLTRERTAIVQGQGLADMRESAESASHLRWRLAPGVTGKLGTCGEGWCEFDAAGHKGWVRQERLWGAGPP